MKGSSFKQQEEKMLCINGLVVRRKHTAHNLDTKMKMKKKQPTKRNCERREKKIYILKTSVCVCVMVFFTHSLRQRLCTTVCACVCVCFNANKSITHVLDVSHLIQLNDEHNHSNQYMYMPILGLVAQPKYFGNNSVCHRYLRMRECTPFL